MAEGAKLIGAGCATIALAGAGAGIGIVFGSFISSVAPKTEIALKQSQAVQSQANDALAEVEAALNTALQGE